MPHQNDATTPSGADDPGGLTLGLDRNADLVVERGSFLTISGDQAIIQDLKIALLTPEGPDVPRSDPIRPNYGRSIFRLLGEKGHNQRPFKREIRRTIGPTDRYPNGDPRVEDVVSIDVDWADSPANRESAIVTVVVDLVDYGSPREFSFSDTDEPRDVNQF